MRAYSAWMIVVREYACIHLRPSSDYLRDLCATKTAVSEQEVAVGVGMLAAVLWCGRTAGGMTGTMRSLRSGNSPTTIT
jgi:hypothetical protein